MNAQRGVSTTVTAKRPSLSSLEVAKLALSRKLYDTAILHAQLAVKEHPYEAWGIIGRAGCGKKDRTVVRDALKRLDAPRQSRVTFDCMANRFDPFR